MFETEEIEANLIEMTRCPKNAASCRGIHECGRNVFIEGNLEQNVPSTFAFFFVQQ